MSSSPSISVIIPAYNEEVSIGLVLRDIPWQLISEVIVVDNGSRDRTGLIAAEKGARVVCEPRRGYGAACARGMMALRSPDIVVFMDADHSDHPDEMPMVLEPILRDEADFVVGSRILGNREPGALLPQALLGNRLATFLMRLCTGHRYTDMGPFRAIRHRSLLALEMADRNYGWTAEMQVKAVRARLRIVEVPVSYRRRTGLSKISGTFTGAFMAGLKIVYTIVRYAQWRPAER